MKSLPKSRLVNLIVYGAVSLAFLCSNPVFAQTPSRVLTGLDVLSREGFSSLKGKRIALVTNNTGVTAEGVSNLEQLNAVPEITISVIFAPEHGLDGGTAFGEYVKDGVDKLTGAAVYSLHPMGRVDIPQLLRDVDILVYDLQSVGTRFYSYIQLLLDLMEASAEAGVTVMVLDRPNPISGTHVEGLIIRDFFLPGSALYNLPIRHGMTVAEIANMFKGEWWVAGSDRLDLRIIKMENWQREYWFDDTQLKWIPTSPNIRTLTAATLFPGIGLLSGTNLSVGRGTEHPFEWIGAPWINGETLAASLNQLKLEGVNFKPVRFVPVADGKSKNIKYENTECSGVSVEVSDREQFRPFETGRAIIKLILEVYPREVEIHETFFTVTGSSRFFDNGIIREEKRNVKSFLGKRMRYLLY